MNKDVVTRELTMEIIVGAFIVMVFLGLGYFTIILSRETFFAKKYQVEVAFNDVMGLREGDSVVVRGMTIGKIKRLELDERGNGVRVFASLDKPVIMRQGYRVTIVSTSILGGRYLQIYEGPETAPLLPAGVQIRGQQPYDLIADAAEMVNTIKNGLVGGGIIDNLRESSIQLREISTRINRGEGTLGKLMSSDDTLYRDLSASVASLRKISDRIESGQGFMGKVVNDDELYRDVRGTLTDVRATVQEARSAIDDIRETTPVVTFSSIFFGAF